MAESNGVAPTTPHEAIIAQLREQHRAQFLALEEHDAKRADLVAQLRSYEKALDALTGERSKGKSGRPPKQQGAGIRGTVIGPDRMGAIETAIRDFAAEHDEFRQVDIRGMVEGSLANSSTMAAAFENLRREGVIRLARKEGTAKFFRLTNTALRQQS